LSTHDLILLSFDLLTTEALIAAVTVTIGAVVKVWTEHALNRYDPKPQMANPEIEFIL
jgi:hypothetical protein